MEVTKVGRVNIDLKGVGNMSVDQAASLVILPSVCSFCGGEDALLKKCPRCQRWVCEKKCFPADQDMCLDCRGNILNSVSGRKENHLKNQLFE